MPEYRIAVIPGDGIGKEVVPEGIRVLDAVADRHGLAFGWDNFDWNCDTYAATGRMILNVQDALVDVGADVGGIEPIEAGQTGAFVVILSPTESIHLGWTPPSFQHGGCKMAESQSHKRAKAKAAGKSGKTEKALPGNRRLDAATAKKATEVERSGTTEGLKKAAQRLKSSRKPQMVLQVPQKDMDAAVQAMKKVGIGGTVKNMGGTNSRSVRKPN